MTTELLFRAPIGTGGAPSVADLYAVCPAEFKRLDNNWHALAGKIRRAGGADGTGWKQRSRDDEIAMHQMTCFMALTALTAFDNSTNMQHMLDSVSAWMLSEMLAELPQFVPVGKHSKR